MASLSHQLLLFWKPRASYQVLNAEIIPVKKTIQIGTPECSVCVSAALFLKKIGSTIVSLTLSSSMNQIK